MSKEAINKLRIVEQELRTALPKQEKGKTILPEDIEVMFAGKMAVNLLEEKVRFTNLLKAYKRDYPSVTEEAESKIQELMDQFNKDFAKSKRSLTKIVEDHPLVDRISLIKGISPYQVAILMGYIKDIANFDTPSNLCVYAGVGVINGMPITKANITKIKDFYAVTGQGEFKGFNTKLAGRLYVIGDSLIKMKGWFYYYYQRTRKRLTERAIATGRAYMPTDEERKGTLMKKGRYYMKGKKNQSIESYSHTGAHKRVQRVFLHLFYTEWRRYMELPVRTPYPIEYLGHKKEITFDEVVAAEMLIKEFSEAEAEEYDETLTREALNADNDFKAI